MINTAIRFLNDLTGSDEKDPILFYFFMDIKKEKKFRDSFLENKWQYYLFLPITLLVFIQLNQKDAYPAIDELRLLMRRCSPI